MLFKYQLVIADFYNIPIGNVKKLVPNFFDKKSICFIMRTLFDARIKTKKINRVLEFNWSQMLKWYVKFNTQKRIEAEKNVAKDGKTFYKLMNNAVFSKTMENLRNGIDIKFARNEKDYLNCTSKAS